MGYDNNGYDNDFRMAVIKKWLNYTYDIYDKCMTLKELISSVI